jgi:hypothetical protein
LNFFSFYYTGEEWTNPDSNEKFNLHKTGFVVYMSIANVGNMATSIDKINLGYYPNKKGFFLKYIWLTQWHTIKPFTIPIVNDNFLYVQSLRVRNILLEESNKDFINIGASVIGVSYFEQQKVWGNFNPFMNKD